MNIKKFFIIATLFVTSAFFVFADEIPFVTFSLGLTTGHTFYGYDSIEYTISSSSENNEENQNTEIIELPMKFANGTEILIGTIGTVNFNVTNNFSLYCDLDLLSDLNWHDSDYSHHLDYSGSTGVKLYCIPNIPSISLSIAYLLGQRADFFKIDDLKTIKSTPFGNGIKIAVEYNFFRDGLSRFGPIIGCSWRYIPRGNNSADNIISAYVQANF